MSVTFDQDLFIHFLCSVLCYVFIIWYETFRRVKARFIQGT